MSVRMNALYAAATMLALATPAMAQETSPWDLRERNAYVLDMQGKMWSTRVSDKAMCMMMRKRQGGAARHGVLHQSNGQLYMASRRHVRPRRQLHGGRDLTAGRAQRVPRFLHWAARLGLADLPGCAVRSLGSQHRDDLRPDRDHADEQTQRRQGGGFFDGSPEHDDSP